MAALKLPRRDFLKLTGTAAFFLSLDWKSVINKAIAEVRSGGINLIWFEGQDCAGDTATLVGATDPSLIDVLAGASHVVAPGTVKLLFHETIMASWGEETPKWVKELAKMTPEELDQFVKSLPDDDPLRRSLEGYIALGYHPGLLLTSPINMLHLAQEGELDPFVLILEGSIPIDEKAGGPKGSDWNSYIGFERGPDGKSDYSKPVSFLEWMRRLIPRAVAVVAIGNCACYGGLVADKVLEPPTSGVKSMVESWSGKGWSASPTGAVGFFDDPIRGFKGLIHILPEAEPFRRFVDGECTLGVGEIKPNCRPAVAVPGCPANAQAQLRVLANLVLWAKGLMPLPELDEFWRPKWIYGLRVHEQCPRAGSYAAGDFRANPGDPDSKCLLVVGCKGPYASCPWNKVGWVNGIGGPTRTGGVCIACTNPGFTDAYEPFYEMFGVKAPAVTPKETLPPAEALPATYVAGAVVAGAAVAGIGYGLYKWSKRKGEKSKEEKPEEGKT